MTILPGRDGTTHLIDQIRSIWDLARSSAVRSVNSAHLIANWLTGRQIVEFEQGRVERAAYGHEVLKGLSGALISDFGKGFSISALKYMRAFYTGYPGLLPIGHAMRDQLALPDSPQIGHAARDLFVRPSVEAGTDMASGRNSSRSVLEALSNLTQGRAPRRARFSTRSKASSTAGRHETAFISHLQDFLLELGSGFVFIGWQVRITLDG
jgi:hypothetical protein